MLLQEQWKEVLKKLENEVTAVTYDLWINTLTPAKYQNDELVLLAPSITAKTQVNQPAIFDKITKCVRAQFTPYTFVSILETHEYEESLRKSNEQETAEETKETPSIIKSS